MIELRDITFENVNRILNLKIKFGQRKFVLKPADTIAIAYAGINEGCPGFANAIYYNDVPVGLILIGQAPVADYEPEILRKYEYVYRVVGFLIDEYYQNCGIGRRALSLALEKVKEYPLGDKTVVTLECHEKNKKALEFYKSFGFTHVGKTNDHNYILVRLEG